MADNVEQELIQRTANAIRRDNDAREAMDKADKEAREAAAELRDAWTALRDYQDKQVVAALRLVA